jgi:hypothetical protein
MPARVITAWEVKNPDPLDGQAGETLTVGEEDTEWPGWVWCTDTRGKSAWVPVEYIVPCGATGTLKCDYTAREMRVEVGDEVRLHKLESGWYWATGDSGESGWIPASHIEIIEPAR